MAIQGLDGEYVEIFRDLGLRAWDLDVALWIPDNKNPPPKIKLEREFARKQVEAHNS